MDRLSDVDEVLRVQELRNRFLRYTREAYALLPVIDHLRILDIGCGSGSVAIELVRLSGSDVVAIDTDPSALAKMRRRLEADGIDNCVAVVNASLFDVDLADESFDLLWEEGVLHLLDRMNSLRVCHRLLRPERFLVMHESVAWFEQTRHALRRVGFTFFNQLLLPRRSWWTDYYEPLEARIRVFRQTRSAGPGSERLAQHEREIAMVKADPERFDSGFFILQRS